jgi:monooxygenase
MQCFCPDADFFTAVRGDHASIVTGKIDTFNEKGMVVDGQQIDADIIVTATGMNLQSNLPMGTIKVLAHSYVVVA